MASFETAYKQLNAEQQRAVDTIDGPVLVIAGPGTGKTQLLSLRVANILNKTDVNPNNILCLTYTESGQQAMQTRLAGLLGDQAKRVEIHTFHGFGTYLIGRFPEYFPEVSHFRPADDLALYETLFSCLESLPRSNPLAGMAYGQFTYQADAASRISQLKQAGILPDEAIRKAEDDRIWCQQKAGGKISSAFGEVGRLSGKAIPELNTKLAPLLAEEPQAGLAEACLSDLRAALEKSVAEGKASPLSAFKKKWLTSDDGRLYFKPSDQLKKISALAELYGAYELELQKRKLYDYDDMILYALERLENEADFRSSVQETFQYILADEYQDTNAAQARIITLIADNPVNERRPNVMVVGDDDQAIYGFQGALGDVMLDFRERWRDVTTITLKNNYRSTQAIIDTARAVILHGQNRLENHYEDIDKSLLSQNRRKPGEPLVFETTSPSAVLDKAVVAARSAQHDDQLAIIATKHKYLRELADRLDSAKIKYYYEGREDLLKDPGVAGVLLLSGAALAVRQRDFERTNYVLPEIIAMQLLPLPRADAWSLALSARQTPMTWWEALSGPGKPGYSKAADALRQTAKDIEPKDAAASLKSIAKQYGLKVAGKAKQLAAHAAKYYGREMVSLAELLKYTDLCLQAGINLSQTVVKGSPASGVILLSAHKSKGLEFDKVHLLHADYHTWFKERGKRNNIILPPGWDNIEPAAATVDDRLRLLYVVMTRAKHELNLLRSRGGKQSDALPGTDEIKVMEYISEQLEAFEPEAEETWQSWYLPTTSEEKDELKRLFTPLLKDYRLSPSHLTTFLDVAHQGPVRFFTTNLLGIREPVHPEAVFGSHVHRALHYAQSRLNETARLPSSQEIGKFLQSQTALSDERLADVVEVAQGFLSRTDIIQPGGVGEYSFSTQSLEMDGMRFTGTADHYVMKDDELMITDFKTGRALSSWKVTEDYYKQKLRRFKQQLLFYEQLFRLSPAFSTINTVRLRVAFVEPSRRGAYSILPLEADDEERRFLKPLIAAVWQHIMDLDFPDTTTYSPDFSGLEQFEAELKNGEV